MPTTPTYGFRYPSLSDDPHVPEDIQNLATDVEAKFVSVDADITAVETDITAIETGYSATDRQATGFGTTTSTTYTSTLTGGTVAGVAFTAPPNGKVKITNSVYMFSSATSGQYCTFRVRTGATVGSGTDVVADDDNNACINTTTSGFQLEKSYLLTGLTPGSSYNVQQRVRVASGTGTFHRHAVIAEAA